MQEVYFLQVFLPLFVYYMLVQHFGEMTRLSNTCLQFRFFKRIEHWFKNKRRQV